MESHRIVRNRLSLWWSGCSGNTSTCRDMCMEYPVDPRIVGGEGTCASAPPPPYFPLNLSAAFTNLLFIRLRRCLLLPTSPLLSPGTCSSPTNLIFPHSDHIQCFLFSLVFPMLDLHISPPVWASPDIYSGGQRVMSSRNFVYFWLKICQPAQNSKVYM